MMVTAIVIIYATIQDFRIYTYPLTTAQITALQTGATVYQAITGSPIIENYQLLRWQDGIAGDGTTKCIYYNEGKVGIGTNNPTFALEVGSEATKTTYTGKYFDGANQSLQSASGAQTEFSAKFDSSILVKSSIVASSDSRIKKNIEDINDDSALDKILAIQPKTYNYIDPIRGTETVYGFIAQQIREVIPEAVKVQKAIIPNIFCIAECFLNVITFAQNIDALGVTMAVGTKISIIDKTGYQSTYTITSVSNGNTIVIDRNISSSQVFVYGTEVDDFHALDKNYIFTLNVCATQRLSQKIDNLMQRLAYLESIQ
jgi:Chaperone of endosialidase